MPRFRLAAARHCLSACPGPGMAKICDGHPTELRGVRDTFPEMYTLPYSWRTGIVRDPTRPDVRSRTAILISDIPAFGASSSVTFKPWAKKVS